MPHPLTTPTTTPETLTKQTAILKLATKKATTKLDNSDKTSILTTEKPTTIIERILSSLSAIQAENGTDNKTQTLKQVGSIYNVISTTPISRVTKSTLPAQISTSVNPLNVLDEISNEQTLQKRTIKKLLELLNTYTSTSHPTQLVLVTPKTSTYTSSGTITLPPTTTTPLLYTSAIPTSASSNSRLQTETILVSTDNDAASTSTTPTPITSTMGITTSLEETTPTDRSNEIIDSTTSDLRALPLFVTPSMTLLTQSTPSISTTDPTVFSTTFSSTEPGSETDTMFTFPSTLPSLVNFEVSPGSVSIFSANDLSNAITPDDSSNTVTISSRTNSPETTDSSTTPNSEPSQNSTVQNRMLDSNSTETTIETTTTSVSNNTTQDNTPSDSPLKSNQTNGNSTSNSQFSNRSGRILNIVQGPVQNSLDNSTQSDPDYFIFAVLNNNTVLRKRPSRFLTPDTPFLVVGVYPNNTLVRKFPNGTLVPMEPVIRVSGFDTRENPPPLPEITSNQVTPDQGRRPDNTNTVFIVDNFMWWWMELSWLFLSSLSHLS